MKTLPIFLLVICLTACKKDAAKYCPLMSSSRGPQHLVDLSPVANIPALMDSLKKYPQLQAYRVYVAPGVADPSVTFANLFCNIYYEDLIVFNRGYSLYWSSHDGIPSSSNKLALPLVPGISTEASITAERANVIAEETIHFENCTISQLGLSNMGTDALPDFRLVWRITAAETGYPTVDLDAHSGRVYSFNDGIEY